MLQEIRSFYEEGSTTKFCDEDFTKMMLLDACFVLYCIDVFLSVRDEYIYCHKRDEVYYLKRDLFLLENQVPFIVLEEVMKLLNIPSYRLQKFAYDTIFSSPKPPPKILKWLQSMILFFMRDGREHEWESNGDEYPAHLLHLLHLIVTKKVKAPTSVHELNDDMCNFGTAKELVDMGIQFKPSDSRSWACVKFVKGCLELPPITMNDYTKARWLNLIAFENACWHPIYDNIAWVASYVCFLHSLVEQPEDVKVLRKAWLLGNFSGRDKDVLKLLNEIGTDLVPNNEAYLDVKIKVQRHYESFRSTLISQLKHEYIKSPWSFLALFGALIALFLTAVQTYFTVWSPKSECDHLCNSLKKNHHL